MGQEKKLSRDCYGCLVSESPWLAGVFTVSLQYAITRRKQILTEKWLGGYEDDAKWAAGKGTVTDRKVQILFALACATIVTFVLEYGLFLGTHTIYGIVVFFPITGPVLAGGFFTARKLGAM